MSGRTPVVVLVTAPDVAVAASLARTAVEGRLAACGNVVPGLRSIYRWEGVIHDDAEVLLLLKTCDDRVPALRAHVLSLHPYDVPEFVVLPIVDGSDTYLEWIRASTV